MSAASRLVIGFDLGGTKMCAGLLDRKFKVLGRDKMKTRGKNGEEDTFTRMTRLIGKLCASLGVDPSEVAGIGVGAPGPLDPFTGVIGDTPNVDLKGFPLKQKLEEAFGVPVAVDNDVNMGTFGEYHFGAARKGRNVLGVFPGTGIGGGLIIEGKLYRGSSGSAAEVGHVSLDPHGPRCGCGHRGCLEAYASRQAIAARAMLLALRGEAPALAAEINGDIGAIRSGALARAIQAGDRLVEETVREAAARIGWVIGGLINIVSPDTVILGGGMVEAMPDIFLKEVKKAGADAALPELYARVRFAAASLGDDAAMMGAARMIADELDASA